MKTTAQPMTDRLRHRQTMGFRICQFRTFSRTRSYNSIERVFYKVQPKKKGVNARFMVFFENYSEIKSSLMPWLMSCRLLAVMKRTIVCQAIAVLFTYTLHAQIGNTSSTTPPDATRPWLDPHLPIDKRVDTLLSVMTPADKMELLREGWGIPGIPRLGIPSINKVEAIHGFSYGSGATIFPQSIALGATWDKTLVEKVAMTIGDETVSANTAQAWSPVLDVAQDPRWGRCEETYGEDPILVSEIGGAWIKGFQSRGLLVTPKHFAVHGAVMGGRDSHDLGLSEREIREIHLVPFRHVIEKYHCQSIMMAYSDFLGVPVAKSKELLKGILRDEWGFDGYIVSDCG